MPRVAKESQVVNNVNIVAASVMESSSVIVEIPMDAPHHTQFPIHVDMSLQGSQSQTLRRIARAFDRTQATLRNGTRVVNPTTALKKIIEMIEDSENP